MTVIGPDLAVTVLRAAEAYQKGEWKEAERLCRFILEAKPDHFDALHLLGIVTAQTGRAQQAVELLSRAITVDPGHADAYWNRGHALLGLGRCGEALESYERAIALNPAADTCNHCGNVLLDLKRYDEALKSYERAIALEPDCAPAHYNRGNALRSLERLEAALESYEQAIALKPDYAEAYCNCGATLVALGRPQLAVRSYERAIALRPDFAEAYNNLGNVLADLKRHDEALRSYAHAIALRPDYADAYCNRASALVDLRRHEAALESYAHAIALDPDNASAHASSALVRLKLGDFARGWKEYEWRWKDEQLARYRRDFKQPRWLGTQSLEGKTILLHCEQGLGDTLQFCRYAKEVARLGANVVLEVQPPLLPLLADLEGPAQVLPRGAALPAFDYHCPLLSLPLAFGTELHNIPSGIPYIRGSAAREAVWRDKLGSQSRRRIGLVWSGNTGHKQDYDRSLALATILPLASDWAEWVSLQKVVRESDGDVLASRSNIRHFGDELNDFADTAALVALMDVVVTVDTGVAHLAGAMGKPVWILLPFNCDWRWLLDRADSPWYPTARLFRQSAIGDWESVIRRVRDELPRQFRAAGA